MINVFPGQAVRCGIIIQENGVPITGLTNVKIDVFKNDVSLLTDVSLTESTLKDGEYYYLFSANDTLSYDVDDRVTVYFYRGTDLLDIEEYYVDIIEDSDGKML